MQTIGLIAALPEEIRPFLQHLEEYEQGKLGLFPCFRFRLFDLNCLLVQSGMGLKRAVDATRALLDDTSPQLLVSFGIAGALQPDLQVGDGIVATKAYLLDKGVPGSPQPLVSLSPAAFQAVSQALQLRRANLYSGSTLTTLGSQEVLLPPGEIAHPVLEMETAGIAQVAAQHGIPLLGIRTISDTLKEPLPFRIADFTDKELNLQVGKLIKTMIQHPHTLPRFMRFRRNVQIAAQNLAIAVVEALRQPLPVPLS